jgi:hypothetical protein
MDEDHRKLEGALQAPQVREESRYIGCPVLVEPMQPDQGIEQEQARAQRLHRRLQAQALLREVKPQLRRLDDVKVDTGELEASVSGEGGDSPAERLERVLRKVDQHWAGLAHRESAEARRRARDADRHIEPEPRFARLGVSGQKADTLRSPQAFDEPPPRLRLGLDLTDVHDRQAL